MKTWTGMIPSWNHCILTSLECWQSTSELGNLKWYVGFAHFLMMLKMMQKMMRKHWKGTHTWAQVQGSRKPPGSPPCVSHGDPAAFVHEVGLGGSGPPGHVVWVVSHWEWWIWTGPATVSHPVPLVAKDMCLWESWILSGGERGDHETEQKRKTVSTATTPKTLALSMACAKQLCWSLSCLEPEKRGHHTGHWHGDSCRRKGLLSLYRDPAKHILREMRFQHNEKEKSDFTVA